MGGLVYRRWWPRAIHKDIGPVGLGPPAASSAAPPAGSAAASAAFWGRRPDGRRMPPGGGTEWTSEAVPKLGLMPPLSPPPPAPGQSPGLRHSSSSILSLPAFCPAPRPAGSALGGAAAARGPDWGRAPRRLVPLKGPPMAPFPRATNPGEHVLSRDGPDPSHKLILLCDWSFH